jgi:hypothetical protein
MPAISEDQMVGIKVRDEGCFSGQQWEGLHCLTYSDILKLQVSH